MYFDGQNLETESTKEEKKLIKALKQHGKVKILSRNNPPLLKVADFSFFLNESDDGFMGITGVDDASDDIISELHNVCSEGEELKSGLPWRLLIAGAVCAALLVYLIVRL